MVKLVAVHRLIAVIFGGGLRNEDPEELYQSSRFAWGLKSVHGRQKASRVHMAAPKCFKSGAHKMQWKGSRKGKLRAQIRVV
ncbi:hypothetical protein CDAR_423201 [Caerostris darwini]|uniref:Uncharacterized protein n=1 Tax=Caerostris darwini TaxID=1538125 RepID=A0AAV4UQZ3_9ARAC|nr:hypothetical protein CDAR_423201 [Caerostris darwini]